MYYRADEVLAPVISAGEGDMPTMMARKYLGWNVENSFQVSGVKKLYFVSGMGIGAGFLAVRPPGGRTLQRPLGRAPVSPEALGSAREIRWRRTLGRVDLI